EHVDRLVRRLKILLAQLELRERLLNGPPVENEKGVVASHVLRQILVAVDAERVVHFLDGPPRLAGVERGSNGQRLELVPAASSRPKSRRRTRREPNRSELHGETRARAHLSILVT